MAERLRELDSSSGVSDQQSVGSSPAHGTCVLEQDNLLQLRCPSDETFICRSRARQGTQNMYHGRVHVEVNPGVSGSHSKHPCLQVFSGFASYNDKVHL